MERKKLAREERMAALAAPLSSPVSAACSKMTTSSPFPTKHEDRPLDCPPSRRHRTGDSSEPQRHHCANTLLHPDAPDPPARLVPVPAAPPEPPVSVNVPELAIPGDRKMQTPPAPPPPPPVFDPPA